MGGPYNTKHKKIYVYFKPVSGHELLESRRAISESQEFHLESKLK